MRRISVRRTASWPPPAASIAAGSPPRMGAVSITPGGRAGGGATVGGTSCGRGGIGGPETTTTYGPISMRSPSRSTCSLAMRVVAPLTKVPLVDRSRSTGPAGESTISQWRAEIAFVRSANSQWLFGSRPMLRRCSGSGSTSSGTRPSASCAPCKTLRVQVMSGSRPRRRGRQPRAERPRGHCRHHGRGRAVRVRRAAWRAGLSIKPEPLDRLPKADRNGNGRASRPCVPSGWPVAAAACAVHGPAGTTACGRRACRHRRSSGARAG